MRLQTNSRRRFTGLRFSAIDRPKASTLSDPETLSKSSKELVVRFVRADPEPIVVLPTLPGNSAVAPSNVNCPDLSFRSEAQGGMGRVLKKQSELLIRQLLDVHWQGLVAVPE